MTPFENQSNVSAAEYANAFRLIINTYNKMLTHCLKESKTNTLYLSTSFSLSSSTSHSLPSSMRVTSSFNRQCIHLSYTYYARVYRVSQHFFLTFNLSLDGNQKLSETFMGQLLYLLAIVLKS